MAARGGQVNQSKERVWCANKCELEEGDTHRAFQQVAKEVLECGKPRAAQGRKVNCCGRMGRLERRDRVKISDAPSPGRRNRAQGASCQSERVRKLRAVWPRGKPSSAVMELLKSTGTPHLANGRQMQCLCSDTERASTERTQQRLEMAKQAVAGPGGKMSIVTEVANHQ